MSSRICKTDIQSLNSSRLLRHLVQFAVLLTLAILLPASVDAGILQYKVTHDDLTNAVETYLNQHEAYSKIPHNFYTKRVMSTVESDQEIEIRITDRTRGKMFKSDNFQITFVAGGKVIRRFELRGLLGIEVPVAVATKDLKRGESVQGAYEFSYRDLSGTPVRIPVYENEEVTVDVLKVNLSEGREIDRSLLETPDLVVRSQRVVVFFEIGGLSLTMIGQALEPGKLGDKIRVMNERSKKTIMCEVTGEGEVQAR